MADIKKMKGDLHNEQLAMGTFLEGIKEYTPAVLEEIKSRNDALSKARDAIKIAEEVESAKAANAAQVSEFEQLEDDFFGNFEEGTKADKAKAATKAAEAALAVNTKSLGEMFVESEGFKRFSKHYKSGPQASFAVKDVFQTSTAAGNDSSPGYQVQILRNGVLVEIPQREPKMNRVIRTTRVTSPAIMYQEETLNTSGAGWVHEDDASAKESAFKIEDKTETVKKVRVSLPISDDMMEDAPYIMDYVNNRLLQQLALRVDSDLLDGDGTGDNLKGLMRRTGVQTATVTALAGAGENMDALHKAMTQVLLQSEYDADGLVMHPLDWEVIRLTKTSDGVYIYGPPTELGPKRIWGLDVVDTKGISSGTALVGAFGPACTQAIRRDVTMSVSTEHEDNWMRGRVVVKLEMRLALVVYRPPALFKLTGIA